VESPTIWLSEDEILELLKPMKDALDLWIKINHPPLSAEYF
jgi:hypothetical protein